MEISANFAFLKQEFPHAAESATFAEHHIYGDPRASCFHARHALERLGQTRLQVREDPERRRRSRTWTPTSVSQRFVHSCPRSVWQKAEYVRQAGNVAVHGNKTPAPEHALNVVRELAHVLYWAGRTYLRKGRGEPPGEDLRRVPGPDGGTRHRRPPASRNSNALKRRPGRRRGRAQGPRRRAGGAARAARRHQGRERGGPRDPRLERGHDPQADHRPGPGAGRLDRSSQRMRP